eukprot:gene4791-8377_t
MKRVLFICLVFVFFYISNAAKFAKVPNFIEKGPYYASTGRVAKIHSPRSAEIYVAWTSVWAGALNQMFYGPVFDVTSDQTDELCSYALPLIMERNATEWNDGTFCEKYFCQPSNVAPYMVQKIRDTKSRNGNWTKYFQQANSAFAICHLCDITRNLTSFINKVQANSCDWSTKTSLGQWCSTKSCGQVTAGPSSSMCIPLPFVAGCYVFDQNLILFQNDITHQVLIPYYIYFVPSSIVVVFGIEFILVFFLMAIPEALNFIPDLKKRIRGKFEMKKLFAQWRFILSIRHQSILLLILATFIPTIWAFIDIWTNNYFYFFGVVFSFLFICLTFIQIITLWSHAAEQSKNFSKTKLSIRNTILIIVSSVLFLGYCLLGGALIIAQGRTNYNNLPILILTGMWFVFLVVVFAIFSVLLSVLTIVMFRILAVAIPEDPKLRVLHFTKLKFTKLTFVLILCFVVTDFSFIFYGINNVFPGVISWQAFLLTPTLLYISEAIFVFVMFVGMTKWQLIPKIYCCRKVKEEDDDSDDDDSDDDDSDDDDSDNDKKKKDSDNEKKDEKKSGKEIEKEMVKEEEEKRKQELENE